MTSKTAAPKTALDADKLAEALVRFGNRANIQNTDGLIDMLEEHAPGLRAAYRLEAAHAPTDGSRLCSYCSGERF